MSSLTQGASLKRGQSIIEEAAAGFPLSSGVYRMLSSDGEVLYIGKAKNLKKRVGSYAKVERHITRIKRLVSLISSIEISETLSEAEALLLEANLIKKHKPRFNILLKDDKSFPQIYLSTNHDSPRIQIYRGVKGDEGEYYGPYASSDSLRTTFETLVRLFKLRTCSDNVFKNRSRPCLQYHIKKCSAPCVAKISKEDYRADVDSAKDFLQGKTNKIQKKLSHFMSEASASLHFEKAAIYRDQIKALTKIQESQMITLSKSLNLDLFVVWSLFGKCIVQVFVYRNGLSHGSASYFPVHAKGEKEEDVLSAFIPQFYIRRHPPELVLANLKIKEEDLLKKAFKESTKKDVKFLTPIRGELLQLVRRAEETVKSILQRKVQKDTSQGELLSKLANLFQLQTSPKRIEIYDNSHLQGTNAYGVMVVAGGEGFEKQAYRKFKIKGDIDRRNDIEMMKEVMRRRFKNKANMPDLLLIDGGKAQVSAVKEVLHSYGLEIPTIGIAKGPNRNAGDETFYLEDGREFKIHNDDTLLFFMQRLRDEAHRFAIGAHRMGREKSLLTSPLDELPGVGAKRKKALLEHFGAGRAVVEAELEDLCKVDGISRKLAEDIYGYFR